MRAAPTHTRATFLISQVSSLCFWVILRNERDNTTLHRGWVSAALAMGKRRCLAVACLQSWQKPCCPMHPPQSPALHQEVWRKLTCCSLYTAPEKLALRSLCTVKRPSWKLGFIPGTKHHITIRLTVSFHCSQRTKTQHSCPMLVKALPP